MTGRIDTETEHALKDFVDGVTSSIDFEAWIISAIDEVPEHEQEALWILRLLLVEYGEGLRPIEEAREEASKLLNALAAKSD